MADAIVSCAVKRLSDLLIQEAEFLYGVSGQVQNIQTELKRMQFFLIDADSEASNGDERVRNWVAEIRDLAYDAEDVIETYALKVSSKRREGIMDVLKRFACILVKGKTLHMVRSEIEDITAKISNLTTSLQTYGIRDLRDGSSSFARQRLPSYSHVTERYIIGRDESIKELVKHLVGNKKNCQIVSIYGMGGLGKTTLAKKVYHHGEVRRRFDYLAWSCISQQCKARDVWEGIVFELTSPPREQREEIARLRDAELVKKLYQVLQERRCLVILDDIWSTQAWDSLRAAFPYEETNSKILLTTRNKEVSLHADPTGFHYEPRYLDEKESWELLQKIAIPQNNDADGRKDTKIEEFGKKMVKHCGGLPLAITVLGGLLATKYSSSEWYVVHETITSCLRRGQGHGQEHLGVFDVLALSYDNLPTELKPCFLYLSRFPKDYEICVDKLIQLWVAEGIIISGQHNREEGEEIMEDVAERYLNELVKRGMVLVGERDASLRIKTCCMHDLMRELCVSKAEKENFLHIVNSWNEDENADMFLSSSSGKIRRLTINLSEYQSRGFLKRIRNRHLRSLLCFSEFLAVWLSLELPVFKHLKLLRVLDLEGVKLGRMLPKDISELIHLRFLSLKNTHVDVLPSSLGNLRWLQTLDLQINTKVTVPNVLWKMESLRHLYLPKTSYHYKTKLQLGNLRNLQTLVNILTWNCDIRDLLNNMTNLRELSIREPFSVKHFGENFRSLGITLKHLRSLTFHNYRTMSVIYEVKDLGLLVSGCINLYQLRLHGQIKKLPDYDQLAASITDILLSVTKLEEDPMVTLEKLPNLKTLTLKGNAFIGKQMVCSRGGFPQLNSLSLNTQMNLEEWIVDEGALPNLCHLKILNCWRLKTFPDGLRFVKTLEELKIEFMLKEFKHKLIEGGEDFYKVQHVSSVIFQDKF